MQARANFHLTRSTQQKRTSRTCLQPFCVLFTPPDDQWRPPVVAMIVISILYHLLNSVRYILMHAVDHFRPLPGAREAALRGAHRAIVGRYTAFGERLSDMLVSITEQIARRLLREDRMRSLHGRFRPDSVMWSWLLKQANSTLIIGSCAPNPFTLCGGWYDRTAMSLPRALPARRFKQPRATWQVALRAAAIHHGVVNHVGASTQARATAPQ